jgi:beta-glucosidase
MIDPLINVREKIKKILSSMTIEDKIAQLTSIPIDEILDSSNSFSKDKASIMIGRGIGQITRVAGSKKGFSPKEVVELVNKIQLFLTRETKLRIPAIVHEECLAGVMGRGFTMFPHPIGLASSWDPGLVYEVASAIREEAYSVGVRQCLAPVLDVVLDPRWGRVEETFGEDPYLVAVMAHSYIRGLQGDDLSKGVIATPKHFAGHSFGEGGRNIAPVHIGEREFREIFLFPFEVAVRVSGALSVMAAYHVIDGVPCHANEDLLSKILREEWGFEGFVVSDYGGVEMLVTLHGVARDCLDAALQAIKAGVDMELPSPKCFPELIKAYERGLLSQDIIDRAVERILRVKALLGLLDNPLVDPGAHESVVRSRAHIELARRAARSSIILLKNDNVLPIELGKVKRIAVVGPNANNPSALLGDYSYPNHVGIEPENITTILQAVKHLVGDRAEILYAPGCRDARCGSTEGFQEALRVAGESDFVIAVFGEVSGLFGRGLSGEGNDRASLSLPGYQEDLVLEICSKTPTSLILLSGRPLDLTRVSEKCSSIIEAWYPGEEGGWAVAEILLGLENPSGRLPISFPRGVGQIPVYYYRKPSSLRDYVDLSSKPLYPFGYGLSYTRFEYRDLRIYPMDAKPNDWIEVSFEVANIGDRSGAEVAQVYIRDLVASVSRPVKELKGFSKILLRPGESKRVKIKIHTDQLAFYDKNMRLVLEPGSFEVYVGSSSEDIRLRGSFELIEGSILRMRRNYLSYSE